MPTCNISGECIIEEGVYCGTGVKIINQTSIGADTIACKMYGSWCPCKGN